MSQSFHRTCFGVVVASTVWLCAPALALIVTPPATNTTNMSSPDPGIGWDNVGNNGVYLGNRWVISCVHVGAGSTTFPGFGTYAYESGTAHVLTNPDSSTADLLLYRLTEDPGLPWLSISTGTPAIGQVVTLIGDGLAIHSGDSETHWDENWMVDTGPGPYAHSGYTSTTSGKRWGTNQVEDDELLDGDEMDDDHTLIVDDDFGLTISFFTRFDRQPPEGTGTDHETQAQSGDSGSGVFAMEGSNWVLAGVTYAVGGDQPDDMLESTANVVSTAAYGNFTFIADLSQYRAQILAITGIPEPSGLTLVGGIAGAGIVLHSAFRRRRPS